MVSLSDNSVSKASLAGLVAIVSGSSSGIGAAIARELSERGAEVVINYPFDREKKNAETVLSSLLGPGGILVEADLSTLDGPRKLVDETIRHYGHLEILINNAGVIHHANLSDDTLGHWDCVVHTNARGPFLLTQAVLPHLTKGRGRIVNMISTSNRFPPPGQTLYAGSKGMLNAFTRVWAKELPPLYGCTVNAVSPGVTMTPGLQNCPKEMLGFLETVYASTPGGHRAADPSEIAFAVVNFCEEKARWINGTHIMVTGGSEVD